MKKTNKNYFTKETEHYIVKYNQCTDSAEKEKIFTEHIYYPFYKLAENIIHTFKFYYMDVDTVEDLKLDIVRMLWEEKLPGFDITKGAKAYSYFGTIVKRWLIAYCNKNYDKKKRQLSMESFEDGYGDSKNIETTPTLTLAAYMDNWIAETYRSLDEMFPKESERVIADAVLTVFKTRQDLEILQKKALYIYIREITGCETPHLTRVITKLKNSFYEKYKNFKIDGIIQDESEET